MINSINQPWAISDKYRERYGNTWADIDFEFNNKISSEHFKTDPMAVVIGELQLCGQSLTMTYKDAIGYAKSLSTQISSIYTEGFAKSDLFEVTIKGRTFQLKMIELSKLKSTISETVDTILKGYEIGLYL
jgi:hypothetical protein